MIKTMVKCNSCSWHLVNNLDVDCKSCNNTRLVIDPKEILCNMCGETMCPIGTHNEQIPHGLFEAKVSGGYDSYHLSDMITYVFNFCEQCLRVMFNKCKIPPSIYDYGNFQVPEGYKLDQEQHEYRVWKDAGGIHSQYIKGLCNQTKSCQNKAVYTRLHNPETSSLGEAFTEGALCEEHKDVGNYLNSSIVEFIPNHLRIFL